MSRPAPVDVRRARVWLSRVVEPGDLRLHRLLAERGPVAAAELVREGWAPEPLAALAGPRRCVDRVDADLAETARLGARLVTPEDEEWPDAALHAMEVAAARELADVAPPVVLWVLGAARLDDVLERAVSVVGSRTATPYGLRVAAELAFGVAGRGWTVVSGGAYGVDGAAHRGALGAAGQTVAVLAGGLRRLYPAGHVALLRRIADTGLVVSEVPPDAAPHRHRFLLRNRLIAAFGAGTVVVEAGARSGTSSTDRWARELGRSTMAVPGPVTSAESVGTHRLIRDGARLVGSAAEVLEEVGAIGADLAPVPAGHEQPLDRLEPVVRRVLDGLPAAGQASVERISMDAGVGVVDVLRALPVLELSGLVRAEQGGWSLMR